MIDFNTIVTVVPDQVSANLSNEAVILNLKTGVYYGLNPVGAIIWSLVQKPVLINSIKETILSDYNVDPDRCSQDILDLITQLIEAGLIEVVNAPDAKIL